MFGLSSRASILVLVLWLCNLGACLEQPLEYKSAQSHVTGPHSVTSLALKDSARNSSDRGFVPLGSLHSLNPKFFTTLVHPLFPEYKVRIKETDFCDDTVRSYTGYIDIQARHLFFYFFESRSDPDSDPVILWTNGGPGCSSSLGLLMELGPCRVTNATTGPEYFKESWNSNANIFFIDQPTGVGFSYAEYGETVSTTEEAAVDVARFVSLFFENFPKLKGRAFHMAGESYGGRYIPLFAAAVYDQNALLISSGLTPINITSVMIGNGATEPLTALTSYYNMLCTPASVFPVLDISSCLRMKEAIPRCKRWFKASCLDTYDEMACRAANSFCTTELLDPFDSLNLNPYDLTQECTDSSSLCYPVTIQIRDYLSRSDVHELLGVDSHVPPTFSSCSDDVATAFDVTLDETHDSSVYVGALLEHGVDVLLYVGTNDFICNHFGNNEWSVTLEWSGHERFAAQELHEWAVNGIVSGKTRTARGLAAALTFATVDNAGHMVPYDKPVAALAMVQRFLSGKSL
ncbi:serine carboxypeptidase [Peniophora sp. CONT]|nr:serine carboxypeptidase [Peniophora sp. CONT]